VTTTPVQQPYQQHCWHFSYFHGTLLEQIEGLVGNYPGGPDLVYSPHPTKVLREGRCNITCDLGDGNLVPAVGFFIPSGLGLGHAVRGIVVAAEDAQSIAYGEKLLKDKPRVI